ncbi:MAG TPA: VOC family protein [Steroidobacteraceae bacterium]|nr:VOC family protein [Steroidobacteraceae bacterium]
MPTAIHRRVAALAAGADPSLIARLVSGWAVMGDPQVLPGYCLLLPDPVVPHLNAMPSVRREGFLAEMALLGDAVLAATGAVRINYAMFGNLEPALHAHVVPRYSTESLELQTAHPWAYDWSRAPAFCADRDGALRERIRHALAQTAFAPGRPDHLDLTVADLARSTRFYADLLEAIGFRRETDCPEGPLFRGAGFELGLQQARDDRHGRTHDRYTPGLHHLAFAAPSRSAVDDLHAWLEARAIPVLDPPAEYPDYEPGYYAVFFADPDGLKLEYVYRSQQRRTAPGA